MHRSLLLAGALGCACTTIPGGEDVHRIRAHWAGSSCELAGPVTFDLEALGDFPPSIDTSEELDGPKPLVVPASTRAAVITAHGGLTTYVGLGESTGEARDIDVSLWPTGSSCPLDTAPRDCDYPGASAGASYAMGVTANGRTLLVAGGDDPGVATGALTVDLATGAARCAAGKRGMQLARSDARIAPFGDKLLVSGGYDPLKGITRGTAEVFDPATNRFDPELVALNGERAHHAAVTLASGEALLVGGVGEGRTPLDSLEVLVPGSNQHRLDVAALPAARVEPIAFRLSDDRVFVGGGMDALGSSTPVPGLVWLSADATSIERELTTLACPGDGDTTTVGSAFTAMPGGAVLAVGGCALPLGRAALTCAEHCDADGRGCPSSEVFWIDRDGGVACCGSGRAQCGAEAHEAAPFTEPVLVRGAQGTPWLVDGAAGSRRFRRFDPWSGQFGTAAGAAVVDPATLVAADGGLFLWAEDAMTGTPLTVRGFRHGVRGPYTQAVAPLLLAGGEGIVPDRAPSPNDTSIPGGPRRDPMTGAVLLPRGVELLVTDTTYADVSVVVHVVNGAAPVLGVGSARFGGKGCRWPSRKPGAPDSFDAALTRTGTAVTLSIDGVAAHSCSGPDGRAALTVLAEEGAVSLTTVTVTRLAER